MNVVVDPSFFAPHSGCYPYDVIAHIESALTIASATRRLEVRVGVADGLQEALAEMNLLPIRETVESLFLEHRIGHISAYDFSRVLLDLASNCTYIDEDVVLLEGAPSEFDLEDAVAGACQCHPLLDKLLENLWLLTAACSQGPKAVTTWDALLTSRPIRSDVLEGAYVINEVLFSDDSVLRNVSGTHQLPLAPALDEALDVLDPVAVALREISKNRIPIAAIRAIARQQLSCDLEPSLIRSGDQFVSDLATHEVVANRGLLERVLRASAEVIAGLAQSKSHALRKTGAGGSPQRTHGSFAAWRHDVDRQYHLHYWRGPDGVVELASMRVHNDFTIPNPSR